MRIEIAARRFEIQIVAGHDSIGNHLQPRAGVFAAVAAGVADFENAAIWKSHRADPCTVMTYAFQRLVTQASS